VPRVLLGQAEHLHAQSDAIGIFAIGALGSADGTRWSALHPDFPFPACSCHVSLSLWWLGCEGGNDAAKKFKCWAGSDGDQDPPKQRDGNFHHPLLSLSNA